MSVLKLIITGTIKATNTQTVLHFTGPDTNDAALQLAGTFASSGLNDFYIPTDFNWKATNLTVKTINPPNGPLASIAPGQRPFSAQNGNGLNAACALIHLRTDEFTRHGRGRIYHPAFYNGFWQDGGFITQQGLNSYTAMMNNLLARYGSGGSDPSFRLVVHSRQNGDNFTVTGYTVNPLVRTLRKRIIGVGF